MTFLSKHGTFALNTSTGNQAITGVGFEPKIVVFFGSENQADGIIADNNICIGAAISSTERVAMTANDEDGVGSGDCTRAIETTLCIMLMSPGSSSTRRVEADFVSQDADGFTIDITNDSGGDPYRFGYLALAGTDLTNVGIGTFFNTGGAGEEAYTGVGFQPDAALFFGNGSPEGLGSNGTLGFGWAVSTSQRGWIGTVSENGAGTSDTGRMQRTDSCIGFLADGPIELDAQADFVSWDADGFTLTWDASPSTTDVFVYIAFKGGQYYAGSLTTQTSTGEFSETGVGFTGDAAIFVSACNPSSGSILDNIEMSVGVATSSTARFITGVVSEDGQGTTDTDQFQDDALIYQNYDFAQSVEGAIDFVSWGADGFTLDQTDADPTAGNEMIYFIFGADEVVGGPTIPVFIHHYQDQGQL